MLCVKLGSELLQRGTAFEEPFNGTPFLILPSNSLALRLVKNENVLAFGSWRMDSQLIFYLESIPQSICCDLVFFKNVITNISSRISQFI